MPMYPTDKLVAAPRGSFEEAVAFFRRIGAKRMDQVELYLKTVFAIAPLVGLDPAVMIAHASHETDYFRSKWWVERLNPAGMGVTGNKAQDDVSPYFKNGEAAARAHMAHMILYATGKISEPLRIEDDPRYDDFMEGSRKLAHTIHDLEWKWAWHEQFAEGVSRHGNEIFKNLPNSKGIPVPKPQPTPIEKGTPSKILTPDGAWDGYSSMLLNSNTYHGILPTVEVSVDALNIRQYAGTTSQILWSAPRGTILPVIGWVEGEDVGGERRWWITKDHERVWVGGTKEQP